MGLFGRPNVVRHAGLVIFIGGGHGSFDEVDLAISMRKIVPLAASGGAARRAFERMDADISLRTWISEATFAALGSCVSADEYSTVLEQVLADIGSASSE